MLYAMTTYFNPVALNPLAQRRRLRNYRLFRKGLSVPLITVELAFDGRFELAADDAEHLIRVRKADVMFQKERLLNIALRALPTDCTAVAWLDCDVFLTDGWAEQTTAELEKGALVQLYDRQYNLAPNGEERPLFGTAVAKKLATGEMTLADFSFDAAPVPQTAWGLAWAARRELLDAHGFYDACILGSGDAALLCAAVGGFGRILEALRMNERRYQHYLAWARPFYGDVRGRVGYVPGPIQHLWHGDPALRRYRERHQDMAKFEFDPAVDIALSADDCWRWGSEKPELHAYVAEYFRSRQEDGSGD